MVELLPRLVVVVVDVMVVDVVIGHPVVVPPQRSVALISSPVVVEVVEVVVEVVELVEVVVEVVEVEEEVVSPPLTMGTSLLSWSAHWPSHGPRGKR
jgi:hypothetical protein